MDHIEQASFKKKKSMYIEPEPMKPMMSPLGDLTARGGGKGKERTHYHSLVLSECHQCLRQFHLRPVRGKFGLKHGSIVMTLLNPV